MLRFHKRSGGSHAEQTSKNIFFSFFRKNGQKGLSNASQEARELLRLLIMITSLINLRVFCNLSKMGEFETPYPGWLCCIYSKNKLLPHLIIVKKI